MSKNVCSKHVRRLFPKQNIVASSKMDSTGNSNYLGTVDLIVFSGVIGLAVVIGIYYAITDRKKKSVNNYYFAEKKMSPIPVGLSIAVSGISAVTTIAQPSETYAFGVIMIWFSVIKIIPTFIACLYYIPLIQRLRLNSINLYLEQRFHKGVRLLNSGVSIITTLIFMGLTVYTPALALNVVTSLSLIWTIALTILICTFYTTLGGMKAVIWTDTLQSATMIAGGLAAMIKTVIVVGGFENVYNAMQRGGRLNAFNFNPDPTLRYTFWTFMFGSAIQGCRTVCVSQTTTMRYRSCRSTNKARIAAIIAVIPSFFLLATAVVSGAAMYAYYEGCDPLESNKVTKSDQMFPYLVVDIFQDTPGVAGLFVAAAFSGTMSSVSSGINAIASLILQDFVVARRPNLKELTRLTISKFLVFGLGLVVMGIALLISVLDASVVRVSIAMTGALGGPILAVFTLGIFFPWANAKGAAFGQILGSVFLLWVAIASLLSGQSNPANRRLSVSIDECPVTSNQSQAIIENTTMFSSSTSRVYFPTTTSPGDIKDDSFQKNTIETTLYALSSTLYPLLALLITVPFGLIASFLTGANDPTHANPKYFVPIVDNHLLPERVRKFFRFGVPPLHESEDSLANEKKEELHQRKHTLTSLPSTNATKF